VFGGSAFVSVTAVKKLLLLEVTRLGRCDSAREVSISLFYYCYVFGFLLEVLFILLRKSSCYYY